MSAHNNDLLLTSKNAYYDDDEQLIDDRKGQGCCIRLFNRCKDKKRSKKNKRETYESKVNNKHLLRDQDNEIDDTNPDNELEDQPSLIESPKKEGHDDKFAKVIPEVSVELVHTDDNLTFSPNNDNSKSSSPCHANYSENRLVKPQDNSSTSLEDNNKNNNKEIPDVVCKQNNDEVLTTNYEHSLTANLSSRTENKQSVQCSSSENTASNPRSDITVNSCSSNSHEPTSSDKILEPPTYNNCKPIRNNGNLFLSSGPEEHFESTISDCEGEHLLADDGADEKIILDSIVASQTKESVLSIRSSTTSEVIDFNLLKNIDVDITLVEELPLESSSNLNLEDSVTTQKVDKNSFTKNIKDPDVTSPHLSQNTIVVRKIDIDCKSENSVSTEANNTPATNEQDQITNCTGGVSIDLRSSPEGSEGLSEIASDFKEQVEKEFEGESKSENRGEMSYYSIVTDPLLYTQADLDEVVKAREDEWQQRQDELERKIKEEIAMRELLEEDHRSKMESLKKGNADMKTVVSQYEKTIVELTEQTQNTPLIDEDTLSETVRVKEQLHQDLNTAEQNLVDAYKRIEKLKLAVDSYKQNEDSLKSSMKDYQQKLMKSEERYNKLKQHASEKIDAANIEIERVRKQKEIDLAGLQAALKKAQTRVSNLEIEISQKTHENRELSQICDELIKKVSGE